MCCPYAVNRHSVTQITREYNEDGQEILFEQIDNNTVPYPECLKEKCGAWKNGQCGYYDDNGKKYASR